MCVYLTPRQSCIISFARMIQALEHHHEPKHQQNLGIPYFFFRFVFTGEGKEKKSEKIEQPEDKQQQSMEIEVLDWNYDYGHHRVNK